MPPAAPSSLPSRFPTAVLRPGRDPSVLQTSWGLRDASLGTCALGGGVAALSLLGILGLGIGLASGPLVELVASAWVACVSYEILADS